VATKKQRQRRLAREAHQRRQRRHAERARRQRQWAAGATAVVLVLALAFGVTALLGGFSSPTKPAAAATTTPSPSATPTPTPTPTPTATPAMVAGKCVYIKSGTATRKVSLPPATPDTKANYTATITTNLGDVVIDLLNSKAPCTVNSFVSLADQNFYNDSPCPRVTTTDGLYILQCGDSKGSTNGSPGYEYGSENLTGATYDAGILAMANSGTPDSNGSQFFMIYKNSTLPPDYTPFGRIVSGLNILQNVGSHGFGKPVNPYGGGPPKEKVQIESVTISKT
jgi:peptidyl-prolyl cis-trans isomerase B (cyclophilin B)